MPPPLPIREDRDAAELRRLARGERVWEAHRTHFYQQATDRGFSALAVSAHVFGLNLALSALAAVTLAAPDPAVQIAALLGGFALVGAVRRRFSRPRRAVLLTGASQ